MWKLWWRLCSSGGTTWNCFLYEQTSLGLVRGRFEPGPRPCCSPSTPLLSCPPSLICNCACVAVIRESSYLTQTGHPKSLEEQEKPHKCEAGSGGGSWASLTCVKATEQPLRRPSHSGKTCSEPVLSLYMMTPLENPWCLWGGRQSAGWSLLTKSSLFTQ